MGLRLVFLAVIPALLARPNWAAAREIADDAAYRVFLKDGQALPSYGEATVVGDRVVFNLRIAAGAPPVLQLIGLPAAAVDTARTARYAEAVRAARYAVTDGDKDYTAMSGEVARALTQLAGVADLSERERLASLARTRLLDWSRAHYSYRAGDIAQLADLFDGVIANARVAAGDARLSLNIVAAPRPPPHEPILAPPGLRESIALALGAAKAADDAGDRLAILRAAVEAAGGDVESGAAAARALDEEVQAGAAYAAFAANVRGRAAEAASRADTAGIDALRAEAAARDAELGRRRPAEMAALSADLAAALERARTYRLALDHYAYVKPALLAYERRVRPALSALDGLAPVLTAIRDMRTLAFARVESAHARLVRAAAALHGVHSPEELTGVHATLSSAVDLAIEACARRREAVIGNRIDVSRQASSAAAGALLLVDAARRDLDNGLFPPKAP
jgi:hypothetical protein